MVFGFGVLIGCILKQARMSAAISGTISADPACHCAHAASAASDPFWVFTPHSARLVPDRETGPGRGRLSYGRDAMSRKVLIPLLATVFLAAPAFAPAALPG